MTDALTTLNTADRNAALALLEPLVERAPGVAARVVDARPFASTEILAEALVEAILDMPPEDRLTLFRGHPALAGREAAEGRMTAESTGEQGRLGLMSLDPATHSRLARLNAAYRARFGHPFIIALHRVPDLDTLFATFETRLTQSPLEEHILTLAEIASVIRARCTLAFDRRPLPEPQSN